MVRLHLPHPRHDPEACVLTGTSQTRIRCSPRQHHPRRRAPHLANHRADPLLGAQQLEVERRHAVTSRATWRPAGMRRALAGALILRGRNGGGPCMFVHAMQSGLFRQTGARAQGVAKAGTGSGVHRALYRVAYVVVVVLGGALVGPVGAPIPNHRLLWHTDTERVWGGVDLSGNKTAAQRTSGGARDCGTGWGGGGGRKGKEGGIRSRGGGGPGQRCLARCESPIRHPGRTVVLRLQSLLSLGSRPLSLTCSVQGAMSGPKSGAQVGSSCRRRPAPDTAEGDTGR